MNAHPDRYNYAIIGQGLAGTLLAWQLRRRGRSVLLLDRDEEVTASKVAAGLINPITGQRTCLSWRLQEFLPVALSFYRSVEKELGVSLLHSSPLVRLLRDENAAKKWRTTANDPAVKEYLSDPQPDPLVDSQRVRIDAACGGFEIAEAHILDVPAFLQASRALLKVIVVEIDIARAITLDNDSVQINLSDQTVVADKLVFCQGPDGRRGNPFFDWVPFMCAKGEILTIDCPDMHDEKRIIHGAGWIAPVPRSVGANFRAGSTYVHDDLSNEPTSAGRAEIESKLRSLLKVDFTVTDHTAAVRPVIQHSRALVGLHPKYQRIGFFNGLGSKGSLNGPAIAEKFAAHLEQGTRLERDFDLLGNQ